MARFQLPNLSYIRQDDDKYYGAFTALRDAVQNISDQGNLDPANSQQATPPPISKVNVVHAGGIHDVQIVDNTPAFNGIRYMAEYSQTADFQNSHTIDLGESQNHRANLGNGTYYWRASSKYPTSQPSNPVYHGGVTPNAVGSGAYSGPAMQQAQGFTGPYRSSSTPPVRK